MNDAQTTDRELWHVQLPSGGVCCWSLDALDAAFQTGEIGPKTYVRRLGDMEWERLEVLLGLNESETSPATQRVAASTPPVAFPASDPRVAVSLRPVVSTVADLDEDYLAVAMKPKRKKMAFVAAGAALALVIGVVGITQASSASAEKAAAAAAPPPPAPAAVAPPSDPVAAAPSAPRAELSDDVKRSLLEKDKARAAKAAARAAESAKYRSTTTSYAPVPKSGPVFHKGGNQYDPLNSAM